MLWVCRKFWASFSSFLVSLENVISLLSFGGFSFRVFTMKVLYWQISFGCGNLGVGLVRDFVAWVLSDIIAKRKVLMFLWWDLQ